MKEDITYTARRILMGDDRAAEQHAWEWNKLTQRLTDNPRDLLVEQGRRKLARIIVRNYNRRQRYAAAKVAR